MRTCRRYFSVPDDGRWRNRVASRRYSGMTSLPPSDGGASLGSTEFILDNMPAGGEFTGAWALQSGNELSELSVGGWESLPTSSFCSDGRAGLRSFKYP